jgi:transposase
MAKALSVDLRVRVVAAVADDLSCREVAARFGVSGSSAIRWRALERETGSVAPKALGGHRRSARIEARAPLILGPIERTPDITLAEMKAEQAEAGVSAGVGTLWRFFERRRIALKKVGARGGAGPSGDPEERREWSEGQLGLEPASPVFIDGSRRCLERATTNMARTRGRAPRGERLRSGIPHGHWKTTTLIAGLRWTGVVAPLVLDGPINGIAFQAYVGRVLVPELRSGDVVVDDLGSHKGPGMRAAIEAAGARLLHLPPCSPDFNPIENAFAKPKAGLRARPPSAPSRAPGAPSAASSKPSPRVSAPTTSPPRGMTQPDRKPL